MICVVEDEDFAIGFIGLVIRLIDRLGTCTLCQRTCVLVTSHNKLVNGKDDLQSNGRKKTFL
jgi:hypothetical protein